MRFIILFFATILFAKEIVIVYNEVPPLKMEDKGILIDIWKLWAKKNNIDIKFLKAPSFKYSLRLLKEKKASINAGGFYNPKRLKEFSFSKNPIYSREKIVYNNKVIYKKPYYAIVLKENKELLKLINKGMKKISKDDIKKIEEKYLYKKVFENKILDYLSKYIKIDYNLLVNTILGLFAFIIILLFILSILRGKIAYLKDKIKNSKANLIVNNDLEIKIDELEKEIEKLKQEKDTFKENFLNKLDRTLKQPIFNIKAFIEVFKHKNLTNEQKAIVSKFEYNINFISQSINNLLFNIKDIENKKFRFNLYDFIEGYCANIYTDLEIVLKYSNNMPKHLNGNLSALIEVLNILVDNSLKYTQKGQVTIALKAIEKNSKVKLIFCIKDSGKGIEDSLVEKLFDEDYAKETYGIGLGLVNAKRIIDYLGGKIWLKETKLNTGTIFCFEVEFDLVDNEKNHFILPNTILEKNILICDDNYTSAGTIKLMLHELKFNNLDVVYSPKDVMLKVVDSNSIIDILIISDKFQTILPKIEDRLKEIDGSFMPKVILLSKNTKSNNYIISKPVFYKELFFAFNHLFKELITNNIYSEKIIVKELNGKDILVAEDNSTNQEIISSLLETQGANVVVVNDGVEVMEKLNEKRFDLVLLDITLPKMDGITTAKRIRDIDDFDTKIIALGNLDRLDNFDFYVTKPIIPRDLFSAIKRVL